MLLQLLCHDYVNLKILDETFILPMDERLSIPQQYYKKIRNVHNSQVSHAGFDKTMQRLNNLKETWALVNPPG